jgi:hypothetical protein
MGSYGYQPQPQVWPQDPRLRRQISTLDVRQLDTRRARIAFILITSSCMTAWRWRAFLSSARCGDSFSTALPISFREFCISRAQLYPFPFLLRGPEILPSDIMGCLPVWALHRDMLGILHWIISGGKGSPLLVYIYDYREYVGTRLALLCVSGGFWASLYPGSGFGLHSSPSALCVIRRENV